MCLLGRPRRSQDPPQLPLGLPSDFTSPYFFLRKSVVRFHPVAVPTRNYSLKNGNKAKPFNVERLAQPSFPSTLPLLRVVSGGLGQDWALLLVWMPKDSTWLSPKQIVPFERGPAPSLAKEPWERESPICWFVELYVCVCVFHFVLFWILCYPWILCFGFGYFACFKRDLGGPGKACILSSFPSHWASCVGFIVLTDRSGL